MYNQQQQQQHSSQPSQTTLPPSINTTTNISTTTTNMSVVGQQHHQQNSPTDAGAASSPTTTTVDNNHDLILSLIASASSSSSSSANNSNNQQQPLLHQHHGNVIGANHVMFNQQQQQQLSSNSMFMMNNQHQPPQLLNNNGAANNMFMMMNQSFGGMSHDIIRSLSPQQQQQLLLFYASQYNLPSQHVLMNLITPTNNNNTNNNITSENLNHQQGFNMMTANDAEQHQQQLMMMNNLATGVTTPQQPSSLATNVFNSTSTIGFSNPSSSSLNINTQQHRASLNSSPSSPNLMLETNNGQSSQPFVYTNHNNSSSNSTTATTLLNQPFSNTGVQQPTIFLTNNSYVPQPNTSNNSSTNILGQLCQSSSNVYLPSTFTFPSTHQTPTFHSLPIHHQGGQAQFVQSPSSFNETSFMYSDNMQQQHNNYGTNLNLNVNDFHEFISATPSTPRVEGVLNIDADFETGTLTEHGIDLSMATSEDTVQTIIEQTLMGKLSGKRKYHDTLAIDSSYTELNSTSPHSNPSPLLSNSNGLSILSKLPTNQQRNFFKHVKDSLKDDGLEDIFNTADSTSGGSSEGFTGFFSDDSGGQSPNDFKLFNALNVNTGGDDTVISIPTGESSMPLKKTKLAQSPMDGLPVQFGSPSQYQITFREMLNGAMNSPTLITLNDNNPNQRRNSGAKPYIQSHSPNTAKRPPGVHRRNFQILTAPPNSPYNGSRPNSQSSSTHSSRPSSPTKDFTQSNESMNEFMSQLQRTLNTQSAPNPFSSSNGSRDTMSQFQNYTTANMMSSSSPSPTQLYSDDRNARANERKHFLPSNATDVLRDWFLDHIDHPYPSSKEKQDLSEKTSLTYVQVANWFTNTRKRNWQQMKKEAEKRKNGESSGNSEIENDDLDMLLKEE